MRKVALSLALLVGATLVVTATPSDAWRGGRGGGGGHVHGSRGHFHGGGHVHGGRGHFHGHRHFHGSGFWWGRPYWWGWPYYSSYYYPPAAPYYVYPPPPAVAQAPENSVQTAPTPAPEPQAYWHYCVSAGAYYPTAPSCAEDWIRVPPRSE